MKRQIVAHWVCGLIVFHTLASVLGADDAWEPMARLLPVSGNYEFTAKWDVTTGVRVRFSESKGDRWITCHLHPNGTTLADWTGDPSTRQFAFATFSKNLPRTREESVVITVKVRDEAWWLYVNRQLVAILKPELSLPLTLELEPGVPLGKRTVRFQKSAPFSFSAGFMDAGDSDEILQGWEQRGGKWKIHTANQDAVAASTSTKLSQQPLNAEHSPNFYNLQATGEGLLLAGYEFEDDYSVSASVKTGPAGGGLVFFHWGDRDYYVLALEPMKADAQSCVVTLTRRSALRIPRHKTLGVVQVPRTSGQWVSLKAKARGTRLVCSLDDRVIFDKEETMSAGGRYGLYVNAPDDTPAEFDDFKVQSLRDLPLKSVFWTRFFAIDSERNLFEQESRLLRALGRADKNPPNQTWIDSSLSGKPRWVAVGSSKHDPHRFGATFTVRSKQFDVGVLTAFTDRKKSHYRFRCSFDGDRMARILEEVKDGSYKILAEWDTISTIDRVGLRHRLELDVGDDGILKAYHNDALVFVKEVSSMRGGSGVYLGKSTQAKISAMTYSFEPRTLLVNKYEKNPLFVKDNFMKHWSSPEGEWYTDPETGETWHKSDMFGGYAVTLPYVSGSEVHFSVEETLKESAVFLRVGVGGTFELHAYGRVVAEGVLPQKAQDNVAIMTGKAPAYTVHCEDHCIWLESEGSLQLTYRLNHPLKGSRLRLKGLGLAELANCLTYREKVVDVLFTEALHRWTQAGGQWRVINRFKCQPQWSHMNGINGDGTALLWGKQTMKGDFCVEFFAGLQHGDWYTKPGRDFNLTVMNTDQAVGSGYTVTCAGWDKHETQRWTRLYKNGKQVAQSDDYTAPQIRSGNKRKFFEPILSRGRDVHGAWYYVKFRRKGSRLQYFFDNQLVLEWDDSSPIELGSFGIWTYRNSMMVARVRITAEEIGTDRYPIKTLPTVPEPSPAPTSAKPALLADGLPADLMQPAHWTSSMSKSNCVTEWREERGKKHVVQRNVLGGGNMTLTPALTALSLDRYAGVRFRVKRTTDARFNFHYRLETTKAPIASQRYVHLISGDDNDNGRWRTFGSTTVNGLDRKAFNRGDWTEVTVWFPARATVRAERSSVVQIDGFGCLRPGLAQQGLTGNLPGSAFAVADFRLIHRTMPTFSRGSGAFPYIHVVTPTVSGANITAPRLVSSRLLPIEKAGLNDATLKPHGGAAYTLSWIRYPATPDYKVAADANVPRALRVMNPLHDRRIAAATGTAGGMPLTITESSDGSLFAMLPLTQGTPTAKATLRIGETQRSVELSGGPAAYPVLTRLDGPVAVVIDPDIPGSTTKVRPNHKVAYSVTNKRYLYFQTETYPDRLHATFPVRFNLATHPVLSFNYAADEATWVSLVVGDSFGAFSEERQKEATPLTYGRSELDGAWHHWLGKISDVNLTAPYSPKGLTLNRIRLGSVDQITQTGSDSRLLLNGITLGPAVNSAAMLRFTPTFTCPDGISAVDYAVLKGAESLSNRSKEFQESLQWTKTPNGKAFQVAEDQMPETVGWVAIRAISAKNVCSDLVEIPFLVDRTPPRAKFSVSNVTRLQTNGSLATLSVPSANGAPLDVSNVQFEADGKPLTLLPRTASIRHTKTRDAIVLDWPHLMHTIGKGGGTTRLTVKGIRDGAMNVGDDVALTLPPKGFSDSVGPSWLSLDTTKAPAINAAMISPWTNPGAAETIFSAVGIRKQQWVRALSETPYVRVVGHRTTFGAYLRLVPSQWNPDTYPYVSIAFRCAKPLTAGTLELHLQCNGKQSITLPLATGNKKPGNATAWKTATFDVRAALKKLGGRVKISRIGIRGQGLPVDFEFHFRDLTVHRSWTDGDVVVPDAYDASGVAHAQWAFVVDGKVSATGQLPVGPIHPARLVPPGSPKGWLHIVMVDRKNKASYPIRLPAP